MTTLSTAPRIYPSLAIGVAPAGHDAGRFDYRNRSDAKMGEWIDIDELAGFFFVAGVYEVHCVPTNSYYIGQSHNIHSRILEHVRELQRGAHKNPAFQLEWNRFGSENFRFRVLEEMPGSTERQRRDREQWIIDARRDDGIVVYSHNNSFDTEMPAPDPEPDVDGIPLSTFIDALARPPIDSAKREPATCFTCKVNGFYLEGFYLCDDGEIRCETCCETRSENLIGWLAGQKRSARSDPHTVRRWILEGRSPKQEAVMALASYTTRFGEMPGAILFSNRDNVKITEVAGVPVHASRITPKGHLDLPLPSSQTNTGRYNA